MKSLAMLFIAIVLSGCSFKPRQPMSFQKQYGGIAITTENNQLEDTLASTLDIKRNTGIPPRYQLRITNYTVHSNNLSQTNANAAESITYTLNATAVLDQNKTTLISKQFQINQTHIIGNPQTANLPFSNKIEAELQNNLAERIYHWLLSNEVKHAIKATGNEN